jgi:hypothetical protein
VPRRKLVRFGSGLLLMDTSRHSGLDFPKAMNRIHGYDQVEIHVEARAWGQSLSGYMAELLLE